MPGRELTEFNNASLLKAIAINVSDNSFCSISLQNEMDYIEIISGLLFI